MESKPAKEDRFKRLKQILRYRKVWEFLTCTQGSTMKDIKFPQDCVNKEFWWLYLAYYEREGDFLREVYHGIWFRGKQEELPTPPEGYQWQEDNGGIRTSSTPLTWRLWNHKLGYMRGSE